MKTPTIYDVARLSGVSISTVSRYNNRNARIARDKVKAIEQAMYALNFKPKETKRSSGMLRSMKIGVVIPSFDNSYCAGILNGMNHWSEGKAFRLTIESSLWSKVRERKIIKQMVDSGVDALVVVVSLLTEEEIKLQIGHLPILMIGCLEDVNFPNLKIDNIIAGSIATNHLLQLGHRRIVHVHGPQQENRDAGDRLKGYKRSLQEAGIDIDPRLIIDGGYHDEQSFQAVLALLADKVDFTAIFAANDLSAYGVIKALHQSGIEVPQQISVIGFDDLITSAFCTPPLTTIRQPLYAMGQIAMQYICDIMSNNAEKPQIPPVKLIVRESTSRTPVKHNPQSTNTFQR